MATSSITVVVGLLLFIGSLLQHVDAQQVQNCPAGTYAFGTGSGGTLRCLYISSLSSTQGSDEEQRSLGIDVERKCRAVPSTTGTGTEAEGWSSTSLAIQDPKTLADVRRHVFPSLKEDVFLGGAVEPSSQGERSEEEELAVSWFSKTAETQTAKQEADQSQWLAPSKGLWFQDGNHPLARGGCVTLRTDGRWQLDDCVGLQQPYLCELRNANPSHHTLPTPATAAEGEGEGKEEETPRTGAPHPRTASAPPQEDWGVIRSSPLSQSGEGSCAPGWTFLPATNHCYAVGFDSPTTLATASASDAEGWCQEMAPVGTEGHLATAASLASNKFLAELIASAYRSGKVSSPTADDRFFLGGTFLAGGALGQWRDELIQWNGAVAPWGPGEPETDFGCVSLDEHGTGEWFQADCQDAHHFVCSYFGVPRESPLPRKEEATVTAQPAATQHSDKAPVTAPPINGDERCPASDWVFVKETKRCFLFFRVYESAGQTASSYDIDSLCHAFGKTNGKMFPFPVTSAAIRTKEENDAVRSIVGTHHAALGGAFLEYGAEGMWFDFNSQWGSYSNWAYGQPTSRDGCLSLHGPVGEWYGHSCRDQVEGVVCAVSAASDRGWKEATQAPKKEKITTPTSPATSKPVTSPPTKQHKKTPSPIPIPMVSLPQSVVGLSGHQTLVVARGTRGTYTVDLHPSYKPNQLDSHYLLITPTESCDPMHGELGAIQGGTVTFEHKAESVMTEAHVCLSSGKGSRFVQLQKLRVTVATTELKSLKSLAVGSKEKESGSEKDDQGKTSLVIEEGSTGEFHVYGHAVEAIRALRLSSGENCLDPEYTLGPKNIPVTSRTAGYNSAHVRKYSRTNSKESTALAAQLPKLYHLCIALSSTTAVTKDDDNSDDLILEGLIYTQTTVTVRMHEKDARIRGMYLVSADHKKKYCCDDRKEEEVEEEGERKPPVAFDYSVTVGQYTMPVIGFEGTGLQKGAQVILSRKANDCADVQAFVGLPIPLGFGVDPEASALFADANATARATNSRRANADQIVRFPFAQLELDHTSLRSHKSETTTGEELHVCFSRALYTDFLPTAFSVRVRAQSVRRMGGQESSILKLHRGFQGPLSVEFAEKETLSRIPVAIFSAFRLTFSYVSCDLLNTRSGETLSELYGPGLGLTIRHEVKPTVNTNANATVEVMPHVRVIVPPNYFDKAVPRDFFVCFGFDPLSDVAASSRYLLPWQGAGIRVQLRDPELLFLRGVAANAVPSKGSVQHRRRAKGSPPPSPSSSTPTVLTIPFGANNLRLSLTGYGLRADMSVLLAKHSCGELGKGASDPSVVARIPVLDAYDPFPTVEDTPLSGRHHIVLQRRHTSVLTAAKYLVPYLHVCLLDPAAAQLDGPTSGSPSSRKSILPTAFALKVELASVSRFGSTGFDEQDSEVATLQYGRNQDLLVEGVGLSTTHQLVPALSCSDDSTLLWPLASGPQQLRTSPTYPMNMMHDRRVKVTANPQHSRQALFLSLSSELTAMNFQVRRRDYRWCLVTTKEEMIAAHEGKLSSYLSEELPQLRDTGFKLEFSVPQIVGFQLGRESMTVKRAHVPTHVDDYFALKLAGSVEFLPLVYVRMIPDLENCDDADPKANFETSGLLSARFGVAALVPSAIPPVGTYKLCFAAATASMVLKGVVPSDAMVGASHGVRLVVVPQQATQLYSLNGSVKVLIHQGETVVKLPVNGMRLDRATLKFVPTRGRSLLLDSECVDSGDDVEDDNNADAEESNSFHHAATILPAMPNQQFFGRYAPYFVELNPAGQESGEFFTCVRAHQPMRGEEQLKRWTATKVRLTVLPRALVGLRLRSAAHQSLPSSTAAEFERELTLYRSQDEDTPLEIEILPTGFGGMAPPRVSFHLLSHPLQPTDHCPPAPWTRAREIQASGKSTFVVVVPAAIVSEAKTKRIPVRYCFSIEEGQPFAPVANLALRISPPEILSAATDSPLYESSVERLVGHQLNKVFVQGSPGLTEGTLFTIAPLPYRCEDLTAREALVTKGAAQGGGSSTVSIDALFPTALLRDPRAAEKKDGNQLYARVFPHHLRNALTEDILVTNKTATTLEFRFCVFSDGVREAWTSPRVRLLWDKGEEAPVKVSSMDSADPYVHHVNGAKTANKEKKKEEFALMATAPSVSFEVHGAALGRKAFRLGLRAIPAASSRLSPQEQCRIGPRTQDSLPEGGERIYPWTWTVLTPVATSRAETSATISFPLDQLPRDDRSKTAGGQGQSQPITRFAVCYTVDGGENFLPLDTDGSELHLVEDDAFLRLVHRGENPRDHPLPLLSLNGLRHVAVPYGFQGEVTVELPLSAKTSFYEHLQGGKQPQVLIAPPQRPCSLLSTQQYYPPLNVKGLRVNDESDKNGEYAFSVIVPSTLTLSYATSWQVCFREAVDGGFEPTGLDFSVVAISAINRLAHFQATEGSFLRVELLGENLRRSLQHLPSGSASALVRLQLATDCDVRAAAASSKTAFASSSLASFQPTDTVQAASDLVATLGLPLLRNHSDRALLKTCLSMDGGLHYAEQAPIVELTPIRVHSVSLSPLEANSGNGPVGPHPPLTVSLFRKPAFATDMQLRFVATGALDGTLLSSSCSVGEQQQDEDVLEAPVQHQTALIPAAFLTKAARETTVELCLRGRRVTNIGLGRFSLRFVDPPVQFDTALSILEVPSTRFLPQQGGAGGDEPPKTGPTLTRSAALPLGSPTVLRLPQCSALGSSGKEDGPCAGVHIALSKDSQCSAAGLLPTTVTHMDAQGYFTVNVPHAALIVGASLHTTICIQQPAGAQREGEKGWAGTALSIQFPFPQIHHVNDQRKPLEVAEAATTLLTLSADQMVDGLLVGLDHQGHSVPQKAKEYGFKPQPENSLCQIDTSGSLSEIRDGAAAFTPAMNRSGYAQVCVSVDNGVSYRYTSLAINLVSPLELRQAQASRVASTAPPHRRLGLRTVGLVPLFSQPPDGTLVLWSRHCSYSSEGLPVMVARNGAVAVLDSVHTARTTKPLHVCIKPPLSKEERRSERSSRLVQDVGVFLPTGETVEVVPVTVSRVTLSQQWSLGKSSGEEVKVPLALSREALEAGVIVEVKVPAGEGGGDPDTQQTLDEILPGMVGTQQLRLAIGDPGCTDMSNTLGTPLEAEYATELSHSSFGTSAKFIGPRSRHHPHDAGLTLSASFVSDTLYSTPSARSKFESISLHSPKRRSLCLSVDGSTFLSTDLSVASYREAPSLRVAEDAGAVTSDESKMNRNRKKYKYWEASGSSGGTNVVERQWIPHTENLHMFSLWLGQAATIPLQPISSSHLSPTHSFESLAAETLSAASWRGFVNRLGYLSGNVVLLPATLATPSAVAATSYFSTDKATPRRHPVAPPISFCASHASAAEGQQRVPGVLNWKVETPHLDSLSGHHSVKLFSAEVGRLLHVERWGVSGNGVLPGMHLVVLLEQGTAAKPLLDLETSSEVKHRPTMVNLSASSYHRLVTVGQHGLLVVPRRISQLAQGLYYPVSLKAGASLATPTATFLSTTDNILVNGLGGLQHGTVTLYRHHTTAVVVNGAGISDGNVVLSFVPLTSSCHSLFDPRHRTHPLQQLFPIRDDRIQVTAAATRETTSYQFHGVEEMRFAVCYSVDGGSSFRDVEGLYVEVLPPSLTVAGVGVSAKSLLTEVEREPSLNAKQLVRLHAVFAVESEEKGGHKTESEGKQKEVHVRPRLSFVEPHIVLSGPGIVGSAHDNVLAALLPPSFHPATGCDGELPEGVEPVVTFEIDTRTGRPAEEEMKFASDAAVGEMFREGGTLGDGLLCLSTDGGKTYHSSQTERILFGRIDVNYTATTAKPHQGEGEGGEGEEAIVTVMVSEEEEEEEEEDRKDDLTQVRFVLELASSSQYQFSTDEDVKRFHLFAASLYPATLGPGRVGVEVVVPGVMESRASTFYSTVHVWFTLYPSDSASVWNWYSELRHRVHTLLEDKEDGMGPRGYLTPAMDSHLAGDTNVEELQWRAKRSPGWQLGTTTGTGKGNEEGAKESTNSEVPLDVGHQLLVGPQSVEDKWATAGSSFRIAHIVPLSIRSVDANGEVIPFQEEEEEESTNRRLRNDDQAHRLEQRHPLRGLEPLYFVTHSAANEKSTKAADRVLGVTDTIVLLLIPIFMIGATYHIHRNYCDISEFEYLSKEQERRRARHAEAMARLSAVREANVQLEHELSEVRSQQLTSSPSFEWA